MGIIIENIASRLSSRNQHKQHKSEKWENRHRRRQRRKSNRRKKPPRRETPTTCSKEAPCLRKSLRKRRYSRPTGRSRSRNSTIWDSAKKSFAAFMGTVIRTRPPSNKKLSCPSCRVRTPSLRRGPVPVRPAPSPSVFYSPLTHRPRTPKL